jgi:hypothetical protein
MIIGVRQGLILDKLRSISLQGRTVAFEVSVRAANAPTASGITLVALALDPDDQVARLEQLRTIRSRLQDMQKKGVHFIVAGGFYGNVRNSPERSAISTGVNVTEAFFAAQNLAPNYTSWMGDFTDSILVGQSLVSAVKEAQVYHAEVDCLPILVDFQFVPSLGFGKEFRRGCCKYSEYLIFGGMFLGLTLLCFLIGYSLSRKSPANKSSEMQDSDIKVRSHGRLEKQQLNDLPPHSETPPPQYASEGKASHSNANNGDCCKQ